MNAAVLIAQLVQLEQAAARCDHPTVRKLILEMEESVLHLQQTLIETLRDNASLRCRLEGDVAPLSARPFLVPARVVSGENR